MKIARVFVQEYPGRQIGEIHDVFSPENHPGSILSGIIKEVEVADDFDKEVMEATVESDGSVSFASSPAKVAAKAAKAKAGLIAAKYVEMDTEIFDEMETVFGTRRADSATAAHQTLILMKSNPELFSEEGLLADMPVTGFAVGAALDTDEKVLDYATKRIEQINAYGVFRVKRIKQFREEKAAIEAQ
jgi:hypothetical protein